MFITSILFVLMLGSGFVLFCVCACFFFSILCITPFPPQTSLILTVLSEKMMSRSAIALNKSGETQLWKDVTTLISSSDAADGYNDGKVQFVIAVVNTVQWFWRLITFSIWKVVRHFEIIIRILLIQCSLTSVIYYSLTSVICICGFVWCEKRNCCQLYVYGSTLTAHPVAYVALRL